MSIKLGTWYDDWADNWVSVRYSKYEPNELIMEWSIPGCSGRKTFDQKLFDEIVAKYNMKKLF